LSGHIERWNQRYQAGEQVEKSPPQLVVEFAGSVAPGSALDLACGPGRNALYLAELGWRVTALDGSPVAIDLLRARAHPRIDARLVDLEATGLEIAPETFDLVLSSYYLQRSLIPVMKSALRSGGLLIMIVLLDPPPGTPTRAHPGELRAFFDGWRILHYREGELGKLGDRQAVVELVAQKPAE
jgi:tellurite methyltransferase